MMRSKGAVASRRRGRPVNASADDTVAAVLNAARRSFAARGYAGTSNREVAAAAGLTHTAIYNHFGSKAQLFTAVFVDVQELLIAELDRSAQARDDGKALPHVLVDALDALRDADPSNVDFLASMYVEVRRDPELAEIFRGGIATFPVVERLRELTDVGSDGDGGRGDDTDLWFWIAFALGLAQISALADADTFATTIDSFRRRFTDHGAPHPTGETST